VDAGAATGETWSVDVDVTGTPDGAMVGPRVSVVPGTCSAASLEVAACSLRFGWGLGNFRAIADAHENIEVKCLAAITFSFSALFSVR
jgi:hypothetical protein